MGAAGLPQLDLVHNNGHVQDPDPLQTVGNIYKAFKK